MPIISVDIGAIGYPVSLYEETDMSIQPDVRHVASSAAPIPLTPLSLFAFCKSPSDWDALDLVSAIAANESNQAQTHSINSTQRRASALWLANPCVFATHAPA